VRRRRRPRLPRQDVPGPPVPRPQHLLREQLLRDGRRRRLVLRRRRAVPHPGLQRVLRPLPPAGQRQRRRQHEPHLRLQLHAPPQRERAATAGVREAHDRSVRPGRRGQRAAGRPEELQLGERAGAAVLLPQRVGGASP